MGNSTHRFLAHDLMMKITLLWDPTKFQLLPLCIFNPMLALSFLDNCLWSCSHKGRNQCIRWWFRGKGSSSSMSNPYKRVAVLKNHSNIQMLIGSDKVSHQLDSPAMKSVKVNLLSTFPISGLPASTFCSLSMGYEMSCLCFRFLNFRIGLLVIREKKHTQQWRSRWSSTF